MAMGFNRKSETVGDNIRFALGDRLPGFQVM